ncbi:MAG: nickel pincer cofactor biosynthesis protein LarB [Betaproteobacteria bacterium]|nr:nickel pincer cofactor biosynthesis protein LarB [Betaproteobacteria bacterium]
MSAEKDIKLDFGRGERIGLDEAIFCSGKSVVQIGSILDEAVAKRAPLLFTRLSESQHLSLAEKHREALDFDPISRTAILGSPHPGRAGAQVVVLTAGTSDVPVSREAARTLYYYGVPVKEISDVGVAGLWRLLERVEDLKRAPVVIVVAGMDAALPTVVGGLTPSVIIGVPTSVGYGVATGGETALRAMLASCTAGLMVMNIDNGYGAACAALRVLRAIDGRA